MNLDVIFLNRREGKLVHVSYTGAMETLVTEVHRELYTPDGNQGPFNLVKVMLRQKYNPEIEPTGSRHLDITNNFKSRLREYTYS